MPGQKRKRLTPGLSGFTKVGTSDGLNLSGADPLSSMPSFSGANAGFSCETPTMAPIPAPHAGKLYRFSPRLSASSAIFSSPMFNVQTPVFEYQSGPNVFHNSLLPHASGNSGAGPGGNNNGTSAGSSATSGAGPAHPPPFSSNPMQAGGGVTSGSHSGLMSPIPFMESPAVMYSHELQHHSLGMDNPPGLSLTGTQPQSSVLDRFKKFFDNQRMPADLDSPSVQMATQPINDSFSLGMPFHRDSKPPLMQFQQQQQQSVPPPASTLTPGEEDDISSGDSHEAPNNGPAMNSELNDSLFRSGSSCHQCKSRRMQGYLSFCSGTKSKRKSCRKKYCDACLSKFYQMQPSRHKSARDQTIWSCPSCQGICCCAACRRTKVQQTQATRLQMQQHFAKTPELYSPATSMAVGLVYFGDFDLLDGSVPIHLPPPAQTSSIRQQMPMGFGPLH